MPQGDVEDGPTRFVAQAARLDAEERCEAGFLLWQATKDVVYLAASRSLVDQELASVPDEDRASFLGPAQE